MKKVEHIGIAVTNLDEGILKYERLLQTSCYKTERVADEHVITAFFRVGETKIELLQATDKRSAIHRFIEKKGEGLHHIAYEVSNIRAEMERLRSEGYRILNDEPKTGADSKLICFVHPKDASGVLTELVQSIHATD